MTHQWAESVAQELACADFGDKRLKERCQKVAKALTRHSDESIPAACGDWGSIKGAYRFFANEQVKRSEILRAHREQTIERLGRETEVLAIQDTTFLNFSTHPSTEGLGPIGDKASVQGLIVHNTLAVSGNGEVYGVLDQAVWAREGRRAKQETGWQRRQRERESQCWGRALRSIRRHKGLSVIHVADREADIYELLKELTHRGERFVIRSCWNRRVCEAGGLIEDALKRSPDLGQLTIEISSRPGQPKRYAVLSIRSATVTIRPPKTVRRQDPSLRVQVVEAWERHPPRHCAALHWRLLTSESVETLDACIRVIRIYMQRWKIEEFHKGLKMGCRMEERQLETRKRLEVFLGLASVISVMLLRLRQARISERSANDVLSVSQIALLRQKFPRLLGRHPTTREALRAVARWGGFIGRKGDGDPGWITLWRGMRKLLEMDQMFHVFQSLSNPRRALPTCG